MGNLGSISCKEKGFSFLQNIQTGFESMQISIQSTLAVLFPKVKRPGREGNYSPPFFAEIRHE
jgi:hypothetical protein